MSETRVTYNELDTQFRLGWTIPITGTLTRDSADDPTYVMKIAGEDWTDILSEGMRIKWTQDGSTRYGLIHGVELSGSDTLVTIYGGTDYDMEDTGTYAISACYASPMKLPQGFPGNKTKWTVMVKNTSKEEESSLTQDQYYNIGSIQIELPIGEWDLSYSVILQIGSPDDNSNFVMLVTLSESTSSASDSDFNSWFGVHDRSLFSRIYKSKDVEITAKKTYYLIVKDDFGDLDSINIRGDIGTTELKAVSNYF
jgi:hypothetical protein